MKKIIKVLFISMFTVCLNISYVTAVPLPGILPFVGANGIKQPAGSRWCVHACTDVALSYLQVLQGNGTIGAGGGAIAPGVMAQIPATPANLAIAMPFNQIGATIANFSYHNPQITCTRRVITPGVLTIQQAYDGIHDALNAAHLQQTGMVVPAGQRPGIAILHFAGGGQHHACITYGLNGGNIEIHDPMPSRGVFNVTRNAFRYMVGAVPRQLSEYYLIQW